MSRETLDPRAAMEGSLMFTFEQLALIWENWMKLRNEWKDSIPFTLAELEALKKINDGVKELNDIRGDSFDRFGAS